MAELRLRQERPRLWPIAMTVLVGVGVAGTLVWAAVAPSPGERLAADRTAAVVAFELAAVAVGATSLYAAPRRLGYTLRGSTLELCTLTGTVRLPASALRGAERIDFALRLPWGARLGWPQSHLPGYYVGLFNAGGAGRVRAFAGERRGSGVLLRLERGAPVLLTPRDPEALLSWAERYGRG